MSPGSEAGLPQPRRRLAIASVLTAMSLVVLDAGMVNVALPTMARSLAATPGEAVLVVTAYQTALVMTLLPCAALGSRFGERRVFQCGVALFIAASVLCAVSPSLPLLVAARFLQGLGGAAVMALGVSLLRFCVSPEQLGSAVGWNALTVALSSAAAPTLGGIVIGGLAWPWLFLVNLPVGVAALMAARGLPSMPGTLKPLDPVSMGLNGAGFALLVLAAEALARSPHTSLALAALAGIAFSALVRREIPKAAPLFPLDLLRGRSFRLSVIASICCFTGQAAGLVALPFYLQHDLGQSPLTTGLYLAPWPLGVAAAAAVAGRLSDRISTAWLCAVGGGVLAVGLAAIALWPLNGSPLPLLASSAVCGIGFGLFQTPNNRNLFLAAPPDRSAAAGGIQGTARLTGQVFGAILMTLLFAAAQPGTAPRIGMAVGAVFALAAGLISILRKPRRSAYADA